MWTLTALGKLVHTHAVCKIRYLRTGEGPVTGGCMSTPTSWCHVVLMHILQCSKTIFSHRYLQLLLSAPRQTRRMQSKTSLPNDTPVFHNNIGLLHQVWICERNRNCEFRMRSGILEFWIFFIPLIFNCQSCLTRLSSLFSQSIFSCSRLHVTPNFSPFLFPPEFPPPYIRFFFSISFLCHLSFLPSLLSFTSNENQK